MLGVPGVQQAVVTTHEREPGLTELVGYYTDAGRRRRRLARRARPRDPHAPAAATWCRRSSRSSRSFPTLACDKVDRKRLPPPRFPRYVGERREVVAPADEAEAELASSLAEPPRPRGGLRRGRTSSTTSAPTRCCWRSSARACASASGLDVSMKDMYLHPTVRSLAAYARSRAPQPATAPSRSRAPRPARRPAAVRALRRAPAAVLRRLHAARRGGVRRGLRLDRRRARASRGCTCARWCSGSPPSSVLSADPRGPQVELDRPLEGGSDRHLGAGLRALLGRSGKSLRMSPMLLLAGSPVYNLYLRALGARDRAQRRDPDDEPPGLHRSRHDRRRRRDPQERLAARLSRAGRLDRDRPGDDRQPRRRGRGVGARHRHGDSRTTRRLAHASSLHEGQVVPQGAPTTGRRPRRAADELPVVSPKRVRTGAPRLRYGCAQLAGRFAVEGPLLVAGVAALHGRRMRARLGGSLLLYPAGSAVGLAAVATVPRALGRLVEPGRVYPLYGFHYSVAQTITRIGQLALLQQPLRRQLVRRALPARRRRRPQPPSSRPDRTSGCSRRSRCRRCATSARARSSPTGSR